MTKLILPFTNLKDGVLRAIAANMHHLKYLDIHSCAVKPKSIEHLLPARDNALGGCPQLVELDLSYIRSIKVNLLKKIILALPKLRSLKHQLLINALGYLTEEDMGVDTARHFKSLFARHAYNMSNGSNILIRYDNLAKSPVFQRLRNNITAVDIASPLCRKTQRSSLLLAGVFKCLPKLKSVTLVKISNTDDQVLPLLESIGNRLEYLDLVGLAGNTSVHDIMRTCRNVVKLKLCCDFVDESLRYSNNLHQDEVEKPIMLPVLNYLTEIRLCGLNKDVCSAEMLITLLQSPWLIKVTLINVEVMSDDVMLNVPLSDGTLLSKVTDFTVHECSFITASPFVQWLIRENCSLQHISFCKCEKVDYKVIKDAAEKCTRALVIEERIYVEDDYYQGQWI